MKIQTDGKAKIEVYKNGEIIATTTGDTDVYVLDFPCVFDYYKVIPIERFELLPDQNNAELADIYDHKDNDIVAEFLSKDTAKKLTKLLNNLNSNN